MEGLKDVTQSDSNGRTHEPNLRELVADLDGLRELMNERDRRYTERFDGQEKAVTTALATADKSVMTALAAADKSVTTAFLAAEKLVNTMNASSDKAITKAEAAQGEYNTRSNEFRGQLADQAATLMPRIEAEGIFRQHSERMEQARIERQAAIQAIKDDNARVVDLLRSEIASLRRVADEGSGRHSQQTEGRGVNQWAIGAAIATVGLIVSILLGSGVFRPASPPIIIQSGSAPAISPGGGILTESRSTTVPKP